MKDALPEEPHVKIINSTYKCAVKLRLIKHGLLIESSNNCKELSCHVATCMTPQQPGRTNAK